MSQLTGEALETIRFAPTKTELNVLNLVAMVRRLSHLALVFWRAPLNQVVTSWILVLSGDVELNPGPSRNWKYPCTACAKPVKKNQQGIQCDGCDLWTHATCGRVNQETYDKLKGDWYCPTCVQAELPFFNSSLPSDTHYSVADISNSNSSIDNEPSPISEDKSSVLLCHLNVQSLMPKMDEVRAVLMEARRPVILGISETWLDSSISDGEIKIQGYNHYRRDRGNRGGGVLVYVPITCRCRVRGIFRVLIRKTFGLNCTSRTATFYSVTSIDHRTPMLTSL